MAVTAALTEVVAGELIAGDGIVDVAPGDGVVQDVAATTSMPTSRPAQTFVWADPLVA